jgi:hypothetical protein
MTSTPVMMATAIEDAAARLEGWFWWLALVLVLLAALLVVTVLRRRLIQPMVHTPSDTTDAWAEAGRRLPPPPAQEEGEDASDEKSP